MPKQNQNNVVADGKNKKMKNHRKKETKNNRHNHRKKETRRTVAIRK